MKVTITIDPSLEEDLVQVHARKLSPSIEQLVGHIEHIDTSPSSLTVRKGDDVYLVEMMDIHRLVIEDRFLHIKTETNDFISSLRLYQAERLLPQSFLQISQSEIINSQQLHHLTLTPNGLVKLTMNNGDVTYSSRRYLKALKEAFHL